MCAPTKGNRKILGTNTPLFTKDRHTRDSPMIGWTKYYIYLLRRRKVGCENDFSYVVFPRTIPAQYEAGWRKSSKGILPALSEDLNQSSSFRFSKPLAINM